MSVSFAGAELTRSERQLGLPPRVSARLLSRPFTVCVLPLWFGHTRSRCCLSGAHCHSISTTRLSFISQAETLATGQSGAWRHTTQPIAATVYLNWQPMRPIATVACHHRRLLTNRMCTACRWFQWGEPEASSGLQRCGTGINSTLLSFFFFN